MTRIQIQITRRSKPRKPQPIDTRTPSGRALPY